MNPIFNDFHSPLNATEVLRIVRPKTLAEIQEIVGETQFPIFVAVDRHAMVGQQFASSSIHLDPKGIDRTSCCDCK
jgi:hypothetical protein